jgi:hypothetical protein
MSMKIETSESDLEMLVQAVDQVTPYRPTWKISLSYATEPAYRQKR